MIFGRGLGWCEKIVQSQKLARCYPWGCREDVFCCGKALPGTFNQGKANWEASDVGHRSSTGLVFWQLFASSWHFLPTHPLPCAVILYLTELPLRYMLIQVEMMMMMIRFGKSIWRVGWKEKRGKGFLIKIQMWAKVQVWRFMDNLRKSQWFHLARAVVFLGLLWEPLVSKKNQ